MEKPTFKQKVDSFCTFLYNSETGQLLGRGGRSWVEIGSFYIIYYICLSAFFAATIAVFYETIDEHTPKLMNKDSLLNGNPGLGYKPMPDIDTTLIHVTKGNQKEAKKSIDSILSLYEDSKDNIDCSNVHEARTENNDKACKFDKAKLEAFCNSDEFYGHGTSHQPCVLLKLNKVFGWIPEISETKPSDLNIVGNKTYSQEYIWIECKGENGADLDNLGKVTYSPQQGFPVAFFPYKNQKNYMAPLVMVKFENPYRRVGLMVMCKAYAKNIKVDPSEKQGSVQFELLVDANKDD